MDAAFGEAPHLIAYAVKANCAGSIISTVLSAGGGVDAVSGGELRLARRLGAEPRKIVLSGVAKRDDEIDLAISEDILALQAESVMELSRIATRAGELARPARVSLRVNPSVKIDSHAHIATGHDKAKFGIARADLALALSVIEQSQGRLQLVGISTHVGSMLKQTEPYVSSGRVVCEVAREALGRGEKLEYVDLGGGFGIDYGDGPTEPPAAFARAAVELLREQELSQLTLVVEPGRSLVGPFGVLVASVIQEKVSTAAEGQRRWLMIDAGMNDLLRPALYQATHRIEPLERAPGAESFRVVGPVCESTDDFGDFPIGPPPRHVVVRDSGAYSFTMASEYNGRPLPAEVFVRDGKVVKTAASPGVEAWIASRLRA
jgi:diaminopimelate decarboxylase